MAKSKSKETLDKTRIVGLAHILKQQRLIEKSAKKEKDATSAKLKKLLDKFGKKEVTDVGVERHVYREGNVTVSVTHVVYEDFNPSAAVEVLLEYEGGEDYIYQTTDKQRFEEALLADVVAPEDVDEVIEKSIRDRLDVIIEEDEE